MKTARVPDGFRAVYQAKLKIDNLIFTFFRYLYRLQRNLNIIDFPGRTQFLKWLE